MSSDGEAEPRPSRRYWRLWIALLFAVATEFAVLLWAADDARERLDLQAGVAGLAPSAFLLGMGLARALGARLLLGSARGPLFRRASLLAIAAFAVYHITSVVPVALLGLLLVGTGVGLLYPLCLFAAMEAAPGLESQASTRAALAGGIAIGTGPLALGALADLTSIGTAS